MRTLRGHLWSRIRSSRGAHPAPRGLSLAPGMHLPVWPRGSDQVGPVPLSRRPTTRELEVLEAVCQPGGSIATAAHELGISPSMTGNTLRSLYRRLGVCSAAQAAYVILAPAEGDEGELGTWPAPGGGWQHFWQLTRAVADDTEPAPGAPFHAQAGPSADVG